MRMRIDKLFGTISLVWGRRGLVQFGLPRRWGLSRSSYRYVARNGWHWLIAFFGLLRVCWKSCRKPAQV